MNRAATSIASFALLAMLASCAQQVADQVQPPPAGVTAPMPSISAPAPSAPNPVISPSSMPPDTNVPTNVMEVVQLDVYQITVPHGAVSGNDAFWKHIEEPVVDVATNDLLYSNGIRAGEGAVGDWGYFKEIFDKAGATPEHSTMMAHDAQSQELFSTDPMTEQRLFYFDRHGLSGKVFDECRDLFMLSYQPAPRNPGCVRVTLCPVVQALRYHYVYTALNDEQSVQLKLAEHLYDLDLTVDLPPGKFLVIAPSPDAAAPDSIGAHFLTRDAPAQKMERVLIFVVNAPPKLVSPNKPASQPADR